MTTGDQYRVKAAEMYALARAETETSARKALQNLALSYIRLAAQADRNARMGILYEPPAAQPQPQAQPKPAPDPDPE
jgi:hypothetical protein